MVLNDGAQGSLNGTRPHPQTSPRTFFWVSTPAPHLSSGVSNNGIAPLSFSLYLYLSVCLHLLSGAANNDRVSCPLSLSVCVHLFLSFSSLHRSFSLPFFFPPSLPNLSLSIFYLASPTMILSPTCSFHYLVNYTPLQHMTATHNCNKYCNTIMQQIPQRNTVTQYCNTIVQHCNTLFQYCCNRNNLVPHL